MVDKVIIYGNIFSLILELVINIKQTIKLLTSKPSEKTRLIIKDDDEFNKMKKYNIEKLVLGNIQNIFMTMKLIYIIKNNLYLKGFDLVYSYFPSLSHYFIQIIFMKVTMSFEGLFSIPFSLISTFYIEQKYGFNKMTPILFILDYIKSELLFLVFLPLILYPILYLIDIFPKSFYMHVFVVVMIIQLILIVLFPILIQPIFNKFETLPEGSLKTKIVELAKIVGFKPSKILKMDGSKRSHHSNAYFIGLFKEKRIVLFDTLLTQTTEQEVLAILCHEFGHWFHNHMWKNILSSSIIMFFYFYTFNFFVKKDDFMKNYPMILKLTYFSLLTVIINPIQTLIQNSITRKYEREADIFAVKKGYGKELKEGLVKIHVENKSNICPDSWYSTYHHSHPTLSERMELIDNEMNKIK